MNGPTRSPISSSLSLVIMSLKETGPGPRGAVVLDQRRLNLDVPAWP